MASMGLRGIMGTLVLGFGLLDFQLSAIFYTDHAMEQAKGIATGNAGPGVKAFNVLDYGAKANGNSPSSINFIRAFKAACNHQGRAMLVIPRGEYVVGLILFSRPCSCEAPLMVQVSGNVLPQSNTKTAEGAEWITFQSIDGLIVSGKGTFNGLGEKSWRPKCKGCGRMPASLKFINGIQSVNAKGFHMMISICNNLWIDDVNITAPAESPNTDGIHMSKTNMLKITNSRIGTGDDCVSIIHGSTNITVENVDCGPGHGISIGILGHYDSEGDVFGITVSNCSFADTDHGARIKTYKSDSPSRASGIIYENLVMKI
ncbi:exopolygalacturonase clone GBGE184-like [Hibiscus syriacus]|uniref:exopolygalacturonase clone GBGE184-like n=1 Tax=Hibiscus syriacus TaxID=106335 RepID=UPI001920B4CE|nr:exopolygalacturonase clone GBGE184-like [Hibiscus syriacus]